MQNVYLGRQPILDKEGKLNSYEVLYRDGHEDCDTASNLFLSASVINTILNKFGTKEILGERKAFVKVDEKFLMNDLIFTVPSEFFIFSVVHADVNERVIERFEQLKERGYEIAINDIDIDVEDLQEYVDVVETLSYVKIDFDKAFSEDSGIKNIIDAFHTYDIKVVATKIEDEDEFKLAKELGCDLFEGYFFAKPKIFEHQKYDATHLNVMRLYTLLMEETSIDEITQEFENNHEITLQLLRYINSAAFHFRNKISSIHHILMLVGRRPLAQWLMLMIYAKSLSKGNEISPLLLMVKHRTELMECILRKVDPSAKSNKIGEAYFVGVLSLIDTVFGAELEVILDDMNVVDEVKEALLEDKGILGDIYVLIRDIESFHTRGIERFAKKYDLDQSVIDKLSLESMQEVTSFENSMCGMK